MRTMPKSWHASRPSLRIRGNSAMAKWTREKIIREILRREAEGLPLSLGSSRMGGDSKLYQAGSRIFGSWGNAIKAAGVAPERGNAHDRWPPSRILTKIRSLARRKSPPRPGELKRRYGSLMNAARRHFGSWTKAVVAAGVDPDKLRRVKPWTKVRIIEAILTRALNQEPLGSRTVKPRSLAEASVRIFGSWKAAMAAAGIDPGLAHRESSDETQDSLIGRRAIGSEASAQSQPTKREYITATTLSPVSPTRAPSRRNPGMRWSEEEILRAIRARLREGKRMNPGAVGEDDDPLYRAALRRYGSWRSALLIAGLNPRECCLRSGASSVPLSPEMRSDT